MSAEVFESEKIRKDQFGAIEDAQKMKATNEAGMSKGATAGSIAIATGCVAASALGQIYIAVPCVIGGALFTGAMKLMHLQEVAERETMRSAVTIAWGSAILLCFTAT